MRETPCPKLDATLLFMKCRWKVESMFADATRETGLGTRETITLLALADGAPTQKAVRIATGLDKVSVARACRKLDDLGLLGRAPNCEDARSHIVQLTHRGEQAASRTRDLLSSSSGKVTARLSGAEIASLQSVLSKFAGTAVGLRPIAGSRIAD